MKIVIMAATAAAFACLAHPVEAKSYQAAPAASCHVDESRSGSRTVCGTVVHASNPSRTKRTHHAAAPAKKVAEAPAEKKPEASGGKPPTEKTGWETIKSKATGAHTRVAAKYADRFQAYIDALEADGAKIYYLGGERPGEACNPPRHKHGCGWALDVCQDWRDGVNHARDCNLPTRARMIQLARDAHLLEGGSWCNPDRGHVEVITPGSATGCFDPFGRLAAKREKADALKVVQLAARRVHLADARKRAKVARAARLAAARHRTRVAWVYRRD